MNRLPIAVRSRVLACLVEGNSIRATARMTDTAKNTVAKLLAEVGAACAEYQDKALRYLPCKRIQCDQIWSFGCAKVASVATARTAAQGAGDAWTWIALCADTRLVPCWMIGPRDAGGGYDFMQDLASRMTNRIQLATDGHKVCVETGAGALGANIDYAMLVKLYGEAPNKGPERKYRRNTCLGAEPTTITANRDVGTESTSCDESQNLTMRMSRRGGARLTTGFSNKIESLGHAVALHFMWYNFGQIHQSLQITPAIATGVSDHVWSLAEIADLADPSEEDRD